MSPILFVLLVLVSVSTGRLCASTKIFVLIKIEERAFSLYDWTKLFERRWRWCHAPMSHKTGKEACRQDPGGPC